VGKKKAPDGSTIRGLGAFGGGGGTAFPLLSEWAGLCLHPNPPLPPLEKGKVETWMRGVLSA